MLSAFIPSALGYPAVLLAEQPVHHRCVHPGPLVLRTAPLKSPTPTMDRDRTVSRRSEPSSRAALIGVQPNPWDRLQPQDATSRPLGARPLAFYTRCGYFAWAMARSIWAMSRIPDAPVSGLDSHLGYTAG